MKRHVPGITRQVPVNLPQSEDSTTSDSTNDDAEEEGDQRSQEVEGSEYNQTQHDENTRSQSQFDDTSSNINQLADQCPDRAENLRDGALAQCKENELFGSIDDNISDHAGDDFEFRLPEKFLTCYRPLFKIEEVNRESDDSDNEEEAIYKIGNTGNESEATIRRRRRPIGSNKWSTEANYDSDESYDWLSSLSMSDAENKELENDPEMDEKRKLSIAAGVDYSRMNQEEGNSSDSSDAFINESFDDNDSEFKLSCNGNRQHDKNGSLLCDMNNHHGAHGFRITENAKEYPNNDGSPSCDGSENPNKVTCQNFGRTESHAEGAIIQNIDKTDGVLATESDDAYSNGVKQNGNDLSESCSSFSDDLMSNEEMEYYNRCYYVITNVKESALSNEIKPETSPALAVNKEDSDATAEMKYTDDAVDELSNTKHTEIEEKRESTTENLYTHYHDCEGGTKSSDEMKDGATEGATEGIRIIEDDVSCSASTSEDLSETNYSENSNVSSLDNAPTEGSSIENSQENDEVLIDEDAADDSDDFVNEDDIVSRENKKNLEKNEPYFDLKIEYN